MFISSGVHISCVNSGSHLSSIDKTKQYRDIAVLLAAASALTESPSLIDRMANALNPEPAIRSVKDALRIIDGELSQSTEKKIEVVKSQENQKERSKVKVRTEGGELTIYGHLPNNEVVRRFLDDVHGDTSLARKIGALASAILVDAKLRSEMEGE